MKLDDLKTPFHLMTDDQILEHIAELRRIRRNFNRKAAAASPPKTTGGADVSLDYLSALIAEDDDEDNV